MSLGSRLTDLRKEKGLTIEELSEKSGLPFNTVKKISAGIANNPTLETMKALAGALDCTLDDFDDPQKRSYDDDQEFNHIGKQIKALRESLGLKQKEFAELLGIKPNTFNGYESGAHVPNSDVLIAISKKFDVTVDYLLGLSDNPKGEYRIEQQKNPPLSEVPKTRDGKRKVLTEILSSYGIIDEDGSIKPEDEEFIMSLFELAKTYFKNRAKDTE